MKLTLPIALAGFLIALPQAGAWAKTLPGPRALVVVHIYDYTHERSVTLQAAGREAAQIFDGAGVASHWQLCRPRESPEVPDEPGCEAPAADYEFSLRIMPGAPGAEPHRAVPDVLGYAVISPDHRGVVATVLMQRVIDMAARSGQDIAALLGRVMAHELGHLVLGSNEHTPSGLMRAVWKLNGSAAVRDSEWRFSIDDSARMLRRVSINRGN